MKFINFIIVDILMNDCLDIEFGNGSEILVLWSWG